MALARRLHVIGDPARQRQPRLAHRLGGKHRMVDTAELDPHHQNHRQLLLLRPVGEGQGVRERRKPAAGPFHQYPVCQALQFA